MADAYTEWLDIPANLRPPTYYQLLGISPSELDPTVIAAAADRRLESLRAHDGGPRSDEARRLAGEMAQARDTLLDPVRRLRYDTMSPDAADPWWKPESDRPASVETAPVAGWWQGETGDADAAPPAPVPTVAESPPAPVAAKANDWWKAAPAEVGVAGPPPVRPAPPPPPVTPAPPPLPPRPAPTPSGPLIREEALAFAPSGGSPMRWVFVGIVFVAATGAGLLALTRPWARTDPPDDKPVVENQPKIDPPAVVTTTTVGPRPRPITTTSVPKVAVTRPPPPPPDDPPPPKPPPVTPGSDEVTEPITFRGHKGGVFGVAVSRSGKTILSVSDDQNVLQYSPGERGKHGQLHRLGSPGVAVVLCNDDRDAVFCDGGEAVVYDVPGRKPRATFENPRGGIRSLAAAPDASVVLTGTTDGAVRWWNPKTKGLEHTLDVDPKATVTAVAIAPDMRFAAFGLSDGRVCTWDLKGRKEVKRWKAHTGSVTAVGYAPDGQRIVSAGEDGLGQIWTAGGSSVQKLAGHDGPVTGAAWLDGRRVVTAGIDKTVRLWDQDKGWKVAWSADAGDRAFCLALDARGRFAAVGLADGAVQLLPLPRPGAPAPGP